VCVCVCVYLYGYLWEDPFDRHPEAALMDRPSESGLKVQTWFEGSV